MNYSEILFDVLLKHPDTIVSTIKSTIEKYKPSVYEILGELFSLYKDYVNNDEVFATEALCKKKLFDAYVGVGFTEDQAMSLMINENIAKEKIKKDLTNTAKVSVESTK